MSAGKQMPHKSPTYSAVAPVLFALLACQAGVIAWLADGIGQTLSILATGMCIVLSFFTAGYRDSPKKIHIAWLSEAAMPVNQLAIAGIVAMAITGHAIAGLFSPIPSWKMFARVPRYDYRLVDSRNTPVQIRDYVLKRAYLTVSLGVVVPFGKWFGQKFPEQLPLRGHVAIESDDRRIQKIAVEFSADDDGNVVMQERTITEHERARNASGD